MPNNSFYQEILTQHIGSSCQLTHIKSVSGGCINNTLRLDSSSGSYFIKWQTHTLDLFQKEIMGLQLLIEKSPIRTPKHIAQGTYQGKYYLLMGYEESGRRTSHFWQDFGEKLAEQHKQSQPHFGLEHDNHIGRLHQSNSLTENWSDFFIQERLNPQVNLAIQNGLLNAKDEADFQLLFKRVEELFPNEKPSLLHGDLWNGNFMTGSDGEAFIFDPAIYYGHREMEMAFTTMFGGFEDEFYEAYQSSYPMEPGFQSRIDLCNLYPLLVHVNLFGFGYVAAVRRTLDRYI